MIFWRDDYVNRDNLISADGKAYEDIGSSKFILFADFVGDINSNSNTFKDNCATKIRINAAQTAGTGLPSAAIDVLETTRNLYMMHPIYRVYMSNSIYYRAYDKITEIWNV